MADEIIHCPSCSHKLRVPPELFGEPVQCPQCGKTFTAPVPSGAAPGPAGVPTVRPLVPERYAPPGRPPSVTGPAIGLIVLSFLSVVVNLFGLLTSVTRPADLRQEFQQQMTRMGQAIPPNLDVVTLLQAMYGGFLALALVVLFAAIAMLLRRMYWLAVIGAVLAMLNLNGFCCVPSAAFSIWALVVLLNPATRATFH
jgi:hypothetical protein